MIPFSEDTPSGFTMIERNVELKESIGTLDEQEQKEWFLRSSSMLRVSDPNVVHERLDRMTINQFILVGHFRKAFTAVKIKTDTW